MSKRNLGKQAAAALKYNPDLNYAPVVVASGLGELAKKIINIADENGVPVYRDDSTAALLVMLNSGETIPVELYRIIAAIYAEVVYSANDMKKRQISQIQKKEDKRNGKDKKSHINGYGGCACRTYLCCDNGGTDTYAAYKGLCKSR